MFSSTRVTTLLGLRIGEVDACHTARFGIILTPVGAIEVM